MSTPTRCPKCRGGLPAEADVAVAAFVACPRCGTVVEADPAPAGPPRPARRGPGWVVRRAGWVILGLCGSLLAAGYGVWYYVKAYPEFREYTEPGGAYAVAFPAEPRWRERGQFEWKEGYVADASATRTYGWREEYYSVSYSTHNYWPGTNDPSAYQRMALGYARWDGEIRERGGGSVRLPSHVVRESRLVRRPDCACAEYERESPPHAEKRWRAAGRVYVFGQRVYTLQVGGPGVSLDSWRAQAFFDSFRLLKP